MKRLTASFLLLFALAGNFTQLALASSTVPPHACCLRKSAHHCHGTVSESDELTIRDASCCAHDCCRAATTSQWAHPLPASIGVAASCVDARAIETQPTASVNKFSASRSTRAPPHVSIA
jgi:hypothetical protein